ncbi:MAG: hypothetical protein KA419_19185 [Acidobacteria bacterium]|nr:hypothetical protein [Acidobacteriota bacterium]
MHEDLPENPDGEDPGLAAEQDRLLRERFPGGFPGCLAGERYLCKWSRAAEAFPEWDQVAAWPRLHVEIGCGKALGLVEQARCEPGAFHLGIERCAERFRAALRRAERAALPNLLVVRRDAVPLLAFNFPDRSVDRLAFLYPDPWPKAGHAARRWHLHPFVMTLVRVLRPGGSILVASDREGYVREAAAVYTLLGLAVRRLGPVPAGSRRSHFEVKYLARGMTLHEARLVKPGPG